MENIAVPASEIFIEFVRASGPGGQNVNKTSTKAQLRWNVGASGAFTPEQKALIRRSAGKRLNKEDEVVIIAQSERSQFQNRSAVIGRLQKLVDAALSPAKKRKKTKVSYSQKQQRLETKRRQSERKRMRSSKTDW